LYKPSIYILAASASLLGSACGCKADLQMRLSPLERTLAVGESFTPSARFFGCGGTEPLNDVVTWTAQDTSIVRVDLATGRTTGLAQGTTFVVPSGRRYGTVGSVRVTVVPR
jgi:hypothetical protein